jgi:hypothetical protein
LSHNSPPYPQIVLPAHGGFWLDGVNGGSLHDEQCYGFPPLHHRPAEMLMTTSVIESGSANNNNLSSVARFKLETDETALFYRRHFYGREHHNFYGLDPVLGPLILSVRLESQIGEPQKQREQQQQHFRIILRTRTSTFHGKGQKDGELMNA